MQLKLIYLYSLLSKSSFLCQIHAYCRFDNYTRAGSINIESLMSCHLLLNLLHELANMILCEFEILFIT